MKRLHRFRPSRLTTLLLAGFAAAPAYSITTYPGDPGVIGDPASWRTPEFMRSYGLRAMGAEFAYAAGYSGEAVRIGLMDSGFYFAHPDLPASRFTPVAVGAVSGRPRSSDAPRAHRWMAGVSYANRHFGGGFR